MSFPWAASSAPQLSGNPTANAAPMDQYNWQQWQAYQEQYQAWNAQYGEQVSFYPSCKLCNM